LLPPIRGQLRELALDNPAGWRVEGEIRSPATLVDAIFYATADPGSIPGVSTFAENSNALRA
jgi:hypothetical protein